MSRKKLSIFEKTQIYQAMSALIDNNITYIKPEPNDTKDDLI